MPQLNARENYQRALQQPMISADLSSGVPLESIEALCAAWSELCR